MLADKIKDGITFDDVLIVPRASNVLPKDADISTRLTADIELKIPIISAAMDTVTESETAIIIAEEGGIGIIHKNWSGELQAAEVRKVKKFESGIVSEPITVRPDVLLADLFAMIEKSGISGFPVADGGRLVGIITHRDIQFERDPSKLVRDVMTPRERLVTAREGISLPEAQEILHKNRIEKLPLVDDEFNIKGLITVRDIKTVEKFPNAAKDSLGRLRVGAAVGVGDAEMERAHLLVEAEADVIVVDTAHGHSSGVVDTVRRLRKIYPEMKIIAGNIATGDAAKDLIDA
ncbi:MAG TPA: IMP dehydrogenase, partial [bacterium]|nr:IMP dehydrogenase [bacterium]